MSMLAFENRETRIILRLNNLCVSDDARDYPFHSEMKDVGNSRILRNENKVIFNIFNTHYFCLIKKNSIFSSITLLSASFTIQ